MNKSFSICSPIRPERCPLCGEEINTGNSTTILLLQKMLTAICHTCIKPYLNVRPGVWDLRVLQIRKNAPGDCHGIDYSEWGEPVVLLKKFPI